MRPEVMRFIAKFEEEAVKKGLYRKKLGEIEVLFLELVLGPVFNYDFEGLSAEFPLKDFKRRSLYRLHLHKKWNAVCI